MNNCMNISIWSITYQHYDEIINQSLNTCIILLGVGRIYSIQGGGGGLPVGPWMKLCLPASSEDKGILTLAPLLD